MGSGRRGIRVPDGSSPPEDSRVIGACPVTTDCTVVAITATTTGSVKASTCEILWQSDRLVLWDYDRLLRGTGGYHNTRVYYLQQQQ